MEEKRSSVHFLKWLTHGWTIRKECRVLTLRAKIVVIVFIVAVTTEAVRMIYPFLAITQPAGGQFLIVEGWIPERAYTQVGALYSRGLYSRILVTVGVYDGDILYDGPGSFYDDYVKSLLVKQGIPASSVHILLCPATLRDRTYHCARVARRWLLDSGQALLALDVATLGAHARRSRLLYQKALGAEVPVGIISLAEQTYNPRHWWRYSAGIRDVFSETLAFLYAKMLFRPPNPPDDDTPFVIPERQSTGQ